MEADPVLIRDALINILENAVEACREDVYKPSLPIYYAALLEQDHLLIDISDDGRGIPRRSRKSCSPFPPLHGSNIPSTN